MEALLIVDLQLDFLENGNLEVPNGDQIIPIVKQLMTQFEIIVATKDWHPANHVCFAANHPWRKPFQVIKIEGYQQILWPMHCVQNTLGAEFPPQLNVKNIDKIIYKGTNPNIDSYSAFFDNHHQNQTELNNYLNENQIDKIYICGLAYDYCVKYTAIDGIDLGYEIIIIEDACRSINQDIQYLNQLKSELESKGVRIINSQELELGLSKF
mgnify:CR=1 FL=1